MPTIAEIADQAGGLSVPPVERLADSLATLSRLIGTSHPKGLQDMRDIAARAERDTAAMIATLHIAKGALLSAAAKVLDTPNWDAGEYAHLMQAKEHVERVIARAEGRANA